MTSELTPVSLGELRADKAIALVEYLSADLYEYAQVINCFHSEHHDVIEVCVEAQLPQRKKYDIKPKETFFIACDLKDLEEPRVLPARDDFPKVPHLDVHRFKIAGIAMYSLCLSNLEYSNRKLRWTPYSFLEDIRSWLSKTAIDELHAEDQALEPFFFKSNQTLVVSQEFIGSHSENSVIDNVSFCSNFNNAKEILIFVDGDHAPHGSEQKDFQAVVFETPEIMHGIINTNPETLNDLNDALLQTGFDLLSEIRSVFREHFGSIVKNNHLLLIIRIPTKRTENGEVEGTQTFAFVTLRKNIGEVGQDIGVYDFNSGDFGLLISDDISKVGEETKIEFLNVVEPFTETNAQKFSGCDGQELEKIKIVAIGAGSLGSQVFDKLFRSGVGKWALIDKDTLYPHNLSRHQLDGSFLGWSKASAVQQQATYHMPDRLWLGRGAFHESILDVELVPDMKAVVDEADVLMDFSAAESAIRFLSLYKHSSARRLSSYAFPNASLFVYLCEDTGRKAKLDYLDMCLYRQFLYEPEILIALNETPVERHRYGGTCADISTSMPNGLMGVFAGVVSEKIKTSLISEDATAEIWLVQKDFALKNIKAKISDEIRIVENGWEIVTDQLLLQNLHSMRKDRLPNETGGVLIGFYDFVNKKIYVADFIQSPEDSEEWPTGYIRGCEGLVNAVNTVQKMSLGHFQYIGEWHSHPDGASTKPSATDQKAMEYFKEHMDKACLPTLMLIVGEKDETWVVK